MINCVNFEKIITKR